MSAGGTLTRFAHSSFPFPSPSDACHACYELECPGDPRICLQERSLGQVRVQTSLILSTSRLTTKVVKARIARIKCGPQLTTCLC